MLAGPKESRDSRNPLSGLKTLDDWNPSDLIHGLFAREKKSLKVQKRKLHAAISRGFSGQSEAEYLADDLLYPSNLCC